MFTSYIDRGNEYAAQKGVTIKYEHLDFAPTNKERLYAIGPNHTDYFPCKIDSCGNVCDDEGIVIYPSMSGKYPLLAGEHGYFGSFRENYGKYADPNLPSVEARSLRTARHITKMTQQELADRSGVDIRYIQKIENGEVELRNLPSKEYIPLAKALDLEPYELF